MKSIRIFARIIAGSVFIFSGFVKGIDLAGSTIKFGEYFQAFHMDFLHSLSFPLAFLFPAAEFLIGVSLLFALKPRIGTWGFLLFMSLFTPLTLILAVFNPVRDCGCFGDAILLTNWQTFVKNLILLTLAIYLFIERGKLSGRFTAFTQWMLLFFYFLIFTGLSVYSYEHLPLFDFRPYKTGTHIPDKMIIPEGAPQDQYKTILIYEKNGIKKEFSMDYFPWQDSTWKFVDQKSTLIKRGYVPPIHDFSILRQDGTDITDLILQNPGYTFLLISHDLSRANKKALRKAWNLFIFARDKGYNFYVLTPSGHTETDKLSRQGFSFTYCNTDETTCKTIIRSNPGLLLLKNGTILGKWAFRDIPGPEAFQGDLLSRQFWVLEKKLNARLVLVLIFGLLLFPALACFILPENGKAIGYDSASS